MVEEGVAEAEAEVRLETVLNSLLQRMPQSTRLD